MSTILRLEEERCSIGQLLFCHNNDQDIHGTWDATRKLAITKQRRESKENWLTAIRFKQEQRPPIVYGGACQNKNLAYEK